MVTILVMPPRIGPRNPERVFLREWRVYKELTLEELGQRIESPNGLGVPKGTVSKWEKKAREGRGPTKEVVAAYAEAIEQKTVDMYSLPPPKGGANGPPGPPSAAEIEKIVSIAVRQALRGRRKAS